MVEENKKLTSEREELMAQSESNQKEMKIMKGQIYAKMETAAKYEKLRFEAE